jgi:hypothetical protein
MAKVTRSGPGFNALKDRANEISKPHLIVGWFGSNRYDEKTTVASVAAIQEYGTPNIPARPFIRVAMANNEQRWARMLEKGSRAVLLGNETPDSVLEKMGMEAQGQVQKIISLISAPPLAEVTVKRRLRRMADKKTVGSLTKPLVDTGQMLATVTYEVRS